MDIGIIGSGAVGGSLATAFSRVGHDVMLASREPTAARLSEWVSEDPGHRRAGDYREAAAFGDVVVLAVPGRVLGETIDSIGGAAFEGSIVIDTTNPIAFTDYGVVNVYGDEDSGAEFVQRALPGVPVVKAFNQINAADMGHPERSQVTMMRIAGDDENAKRTVTQLVEGLGWTVRDLGPLQRSRALERGVVDWIRKAQR